MKEVGKIEFEFKALGFKDHSCVALTWPKSIMSHIEMICKDKVEIKCMEIHASGGEKRWIGSEFMWVSVSRGEIRMESNQTMNQPST